MFVNPEEQGFLESQWVRFGVGIAEFGFIHHTKSETEVANGNQPFYARNDLNKDSYPLLERRYTVNAVGLH